MSSWNLRPPFFIIPDAARKYNGRMNAHSATAAENEILTLNSYL
jgi:hypothetical protein